MAYKIGDVVWSVETTGSTLKVKRYKISAIDGKTLVISRGKTKRTVHQYYNGSYENRGLFGGLFSFIAIYPTKKQALRDALKWTTQNIKRIKPCITFLRRMEKSAQSFKEQLKA